VTSDANLQATLAPFKKLTGDEVAALSAEMQFNLPQITCAQLNARPAGSMLDPKQSFRFETGR